MLRFTPFRQGILKSLPRPRSVVVRGEGVVGDVLVRGWRPLRAVSALTATSMAPRLAYTKDRTRPACRSAARPGTLLIRYPDASFSVRALAQDAGGDGRRQRGHRGGMKPTGPRRPTATTSPQPVGRVGSHWWVQLNPSQKRWIRAQASVSSSVELA